MDAGIGENVDLYRLKRIGESSRLLSRLANSVQLGCFFEIVGPEESATSIRPRGAFHSEHIRERLAAIAGHRYLARYHDA